MSIITHGPYLKGTQLLCVIFTPGFFHADRLRSGFSTCANLKCTYVCSIQILVYGHTQMHKHTCVLQCSPAIGGLAQTRPIKMHHPWRLIVSFPNLNWLQRFTFLGMSGKNNTMLTKIKQFKSNRGTITLSSIFALENRKS